MANVTSAHNTANAAVAGWLAIDGRATARTRMSATMSGAMASVVSAAVRRGVEGTTTARQIRVKAIPSVAVSMATIGSLISKPPRYANAAAMIAKAMPTVNVATTSRAASVRIPSTRARRATSQTTAMVMDAVTCAATPGLPSTPVHSKSGENTASRPRRSGRKLNDRMLFQKAKMASRSWKNCRPSAVSRPPDEIAMWKCEREAAIRWSIAVSGVEL